MNKNSLKILVTIVLIYASTARTGYAEDLDSLIIHCLEFTEYQLVQTVDAMPDSMWYPYRTVEAGTPNEGKWRISPAGSWVSGWFPGCLWYMYQWTFKDVWRQWAEKWTVNLEDTKINTGTHDVGFIILCSYGNGYRLTGNDAYRDVLLEAAGSLSTRFNPLIGCITHHDRTQRLELMMDTMMNLELLLWASKNGGDPEWSDMVMSHALKTMEDLIREDGSSYQDAYYDPNTGDLIHQTNHQGLADSTTWARGHAWGIYGFTMVYRETGDFRFLESARRLADFFIEHLPDDCVPNWDFDASEELKDVSASAITVSALLELSTLVLDDDARAKYWDAALNILSSLCSPDYLAEGTNSSGILLHGVQNHNKQKGIDVSLIYADYYFIEAMLRYLEILDRTIPSSVVLLQNYPNPFNMMTQISFSIPQSDHVILEIYNVLGQKIRTLTEGVMTPGFHSFEWNGTDKLGRPASSGMYVTRLETVGVSRSKKMLLTR